jgi:hypothetical protein
MISRTLLIGLRSCRCRLSGLPYHCGRDCQGSLISVLLRLPSQFSHPPSSAHPRSGSLNSKRKSRLLASEGDSRPFAAALRALLCAWLTCERSLMQFDVLYLFFMLLGSTPALAVVAIVAIIVHYNLRRGAWRLRRRLGRRHVGFCPSSAALGTACQFMQVYHRPSVAHILEAKRNEAADEDEDGDPERCAKRLSQQLKRIRRGEPANRLVVRLK